MMEDMEIGSVASLASASIAALVAIASAVSALRSKRSAIEERRRAAELNESTQRLAEAAEIQAAAAERHAATAQDQAEAAQSQAEQSRRIAEAIESLSDSAGVPEWVVTLEEVASHRKFELRNTGRGDALVPELVPGAGAWGEGPRNRQSPPARIGSGESVPIYLQPYEGRWSSSIGLRSLGFQDVTIPLSENVHESSGPITPRAHEAGASPTESSDRPGP